MINKSTKEMIEIMQAFDDGKQIQVYNADANAWFDEANPNWDWFYKDYRIKEKSPDYIQGYSAATKDMYNCLNSIVERHRLKLKDPFTRNEHAAITDMLSDFVNYINELGHELDKTEDEDGK